MGSPSEQAVRRHVWTADDDALLDSILALRTAWEEHRGQVTLAALGLDPALVTFVVSGLCPKHGQFVAEWTGRACDRPPLEARCPGANERRCGELSPVFVLV